MPKTGDDVVVDEAGGLHECIAYRRAHELEAMVLQGLTHLVGLTCRHWYPFFAFPPVLYRSVLIFLAILSCTPCCLSMSGKPGMQSEFFISIKINSSDAAIP